MAAKASAIKRNIVAAAKENKAAKKKAK